MLARAAEPTHEDARRKRGEMNGETGRTSALLVQSQAAQDRGDRMAARQILEHAAMAATAEGPAAVANVELTRGLLAQDHGDLDLAIDHFTYAASYAVRCAPDPAGLAIYYQARACLGGAYREQGRYREAEQVLRQAIDDAGVDAVAPEWLAMLCNQLGIVFKYSGRFDEAAELYARAVSLIIEHSGPEHPDLAALYHNIGGLAHARGDYAAAEEPARRAVEIREKALGGDHLGIGEKAFDRDHLALAADRAALAPILLELGKVDEAAVLLSQALEVFQRAYGPEHYEVAVVTNNLAAVAYRQGRSTDAEELFRKCLAIKEKLLGLDHPDLTPTLNNLALLRRKAGDSVGAERLYGRAVSILEPRVEDDHPTLTAVRTGLTKARAGRLNSEDHPSS